MFGVFEADLKTAELRKNGARVKLQLQPFQLLTALLERPGEIVTRDELRQRLWPQDTFVDFDHSLNTAIAKLRDVLGDSASNPRFVETLAKRGYRFLADVTTMPEQPTIAPPAPPPTSSFPKEQMRAGSEQTIPDQAQDAQSQLPRASRRTVRVLFILSQIMYMVFYLCALFRIDRLEESAGWAWRNAGHIMYSTYLVTALAGIAMRLYLITATAFDYHLLTEKYRVLFPFLLLLDMLWALSPFLIANRIGLGLALGATAALIYMPFAQRVLVKMMSSGIAATR